MIRKRIHHTTENNKRIRYYFDIGHVYEHDKDRDKKLKNISLWTWNGARINVEKLKRDKETNLISNHKALYGNDYYKSRVAGRYDGNTFFISIKRPTDQIDMSDRLIDSLIKLLLKEFRLVKQIWLFPEAKRLY